MLLVGAVVVGLVGAVVAVAGGTIVAVVVPRGVEVPGVGTAAAKGSPAAQETLAGLLALGIYGLREIPRGFKLINLFSQRELADFERSKAVIN